MLTRNQFHVPLRDLPPDGKSWTVNDTDLWKKPCTELGLNCRLEGSPEMRVSALPLDRGWLVRGHLRCPVVMPCSRCAADCTQSLDASFEEYIELPDEGEAQDIHAEEHFVVIDNGMPFLNLAAIAWEEFVLALPQTPLCSEECKGLCPHCGADLNEGPCGCHAWEGDPRLAVLRGLKVEKT